MVCCFTFKLPSPNPPLTLSSHAVARAEQETVLRESRPVSQYFYDSNHFHCDNIESLGHSVAHERQSLCCFLKRPWRSKYSNIK